MLEKTFCKECVCAEKVSNPMNIGKMVMICHLDPPKAFLFPTQTGTGQVGVELRAFSPPLDDKCFCFQGQKRTN